MSQGENLLDDLLSVATEELENLNKKENILKETDIFKYENNFPSKNVGITDEPSCSMIHNGDTDSSDDEGNRNYENAKYSECGKNIKQLLENESPSPRYDKQTSSSWKSKAIFAPPNKVIDTPQNRNVEKKTINFDVYTDPIFGLRIINPLISSVALKERMVGREAVSFSKISRYLQVYGKEKDWVIAGVIANKSAVKTSQKGSQFCIWTLTDLKDDIKTVSLFLFSGAHKQLWKTVVGTVIGVLNPNVLDKKEGSKDEACLSVDNAQKVMIFGQSKDFGTCKSVKKNGESCTAIVNLNKCDFCIYHIKQEYQKCSKRSELQSNFTGKGLTALRNKVLGKNEVFYAGKSYTAIPAKRNRRLEQRDNSRLNSLNGKGISVNANDSLKAKNKNTSVRKQNASRLDVPQAQRIRDIELLEKLGGSVESRKKLMGIHSTDNLESLKYNAINVDKVEKHDKSSTHEEKCENDVEETDKTGFQRKLSKAVTVDEARDVIAKLKSKNKLNQHSNKSKMDTNANGTFSDFDMTDMDLDYGDTDLSPIKTKEFPISNNLPNPITNTNDTFCDKNGIDKNKLSQPISKEMLTKNNTKNIANDPKNTTVMKTLKTSKAYLNSIPLGFPILSGGTSNGIIDLNKPIIRRHIDAAKLKALKTIQKNGPLKKADPNSVKGSGRKRPIEETDTSENIAKKSKLAESEFISDRFKKMMAATSKHLDLLECRDDEEKDKYFSKMERKEQMEEKMTNTFKIACKAVKCLKCKYTSFSASDLCKTERHPLKVFDAMKRFFKCGNCGNRIVSLDIVPTGMCKNCGSGKWEKTGMMKEKVCAISHSLSIRGGEQQFVNSVIADANMSLLVPDD